MVFRGRPSAACARCRSRRLRCDFQTGACGSCIRAVVPCSGYRDTQQLRIRDESELVARRSKDLVSVVPQSIRLSVGVQARDAFFTIYAPGISMYWDFLKRHYCPSHAPEHLTLAIEAVSLAYSWHQSYSDAVLAMARRRYISALRVTNRILNSAEEATKDSTLLAILLLDLFEHIINGQSNASLTYHLNGGLALVRLRGHENFQDCLSVRILVRISTNYLIGCIARRLPVFDDLMAIRAHLEKHIDVQDPNWQTTKLMVLYANLRNAVRQGTISMNERVGATIALDAKFQLLEADMPPNWRYTTMHLEYESDRIFDFRVDTYPNRGVCQGWNGIRAFRLLLNEHLLEHYLASSAGDENFDSAAAAQSNMEGLAREICACAPQYVDCSGTVRQRPPQSGTSNCLARIPENVPLRGFGHHHTLEQQLDCYTIIFPLYVAGRCKLVPNMRPWVITQLRYISSHFYIRSAEVVAQILEGEKDVSPWDVYSMIGSYAFAA